MLRIAGYFRPLRPAHYLSVAALAAFAPTSVSAAPLNGLFKGNAYGAIANGVAGGTRQDLAQGRLPPAAMRRHGRRHTAKDRQRVQRRTSGTLLTHRHTTSTIFTDKTDISAQMISTSTLDDVSLFGGLVTADHDQVGGHRRRRCRHRSRRVHRIRTCRARHRRQVHRRRQSRAGSTHGIRCPASARSPQEDRPSTATRLLAAHHRGHAGDQGHDTATLSGCRSAAR